MSVGRHLRIIAATVAIALALPVATGGSARAIMLPRASEVARRNSNDTLRCIGGYFVATPGNATAISKCYIDWPAIATSKRAAMPGTTVVQTSADARRYSTPLFRATTSTISTGSPQCVGTSTAYYGPQTSPIGAIPAGAVVVVCDPYTTGLHSGLIAYTGPTASNILWPICPTGWTNSNCDSNTGGAANPLGRYAGWDGGAQYTSAADWLVRSVEIPETYPGMTGFPPAECLALRMYIATPGQPIPRNSTLDVSFPSGWGALVATEAATLRYRWSPADPWVTFYDGPTATTSPASTWTFTNRSTGTRTGVTFEVECTGRGTAYLRGDNSSGSTDPQANRACATVAIGWPDEGIYSADEEVGFSLVIGGAAPDEVDQLVFSSGRLGSELADAVDTVVDVASITFGDFDGVNSTVADGLPAASYIGRFVFTEDWTTDDGLAMRCHDGSGYLNFQLIAPPGVTYAPADEGYAERFNTCLDGVNFGWRPSSWVPAFFRTTGCVAEVLFVPSDADVDSLTDGASEASEKAPISYIVAVGGEMTGMLSGAPAAVDSGRNGCLTVLGPMEEIGLDEAQTACPSTLDGSRMTTARSIMGAGSWVVIALSYFGATRKLIR